MSKPSPSFVARHPAGDTPVEVAPLAGNSAVEAVCPAGDGAGAAGEPAVFAATPSGAGTDAIGAAGSEVVAGLACDTSITPVDAGASGAAGATVAHDLLTWYDRHARDLPWRMPPGSKTRPDPYRVWLSEIMLQQTTVAAVRGYFARFTARWPDVQALADADESEVMAEWAGLGYYARARNLIACARRVASLGGFPETREALRALPGVGDYTSAAIAAIAFDRPETVVDGNVERVTARLFAVTEPLPGARRRLRELAARLTPTRRPGDFAQATMDLGATICTPRNQACGICPLRPHCAASTQGIAAELPRRQPKTQRPRRKGVVWVLISPQGDVLVERRPDSGLLGGMLAFPSAGWDGTPIDPPADLHWREAGIVTHVFTHFSLELTVLTATAEANPRRGTWVRADAFAPGALPGLFRKVWKTASS